MKKIHLNFAQNSHYQAQKINSQSALKFGFDESFNFSMKDIDSVFYEKNKKILEQSRGSGYWLWKPYFILKLLNEFSDNDVIFYTDSGSELISHVNPLIELLKTQDIIPFSIDGALEIHNTKRDCFILMDCDEKKYHYSTHLNAAFILLKKTNFTINFFNEYLKYASDERCITDNPNNILIEHPENRGHRHDQSIYSLMCKKHNLKTFRDPSQWGNNLPDDKDKFGQIINHSRYNG